MNRLHRISIMVFLINFLVASLAVAKEQLVVFSGRKEPLIKPVIELFEKKSGIKVTLKTGKSAALGQQILQEQPKPTADIFIAKESGSLEFLRLKNAFEPYTSEQMERIPEKFRARDGSWIGVSGRSRAVIFNKDLIKEEDVPRTLDELRGPQYKGKVAAVNMSNESFVAWVSALRIHLGNDLVEKLLSDLKNSGITLVSKSHTDIRKAVGRGEYPLGLINHYYYHLQRNESDPELRNVGVVYLDQEKGARGELVNVSGAAIVKGAPNLSSAKRFMHFLTSDEAQRLFAEVNFEYPLVPGVSAHKEVYTALGCEKASAIDCLNVMAVNLDDLGPAMEETLDLLERVEWY